MTELSEPIRRFPEHPLVRSLAGYCAKPSPFKILGVAHRELSHSSLLCWLCTSEALRDFQAALNNRIARDVNESSGRTDIVPPTDELRNADVSAFTEVGDPTSGRLDVLLRYCGLKYVIGVEVKLWAGEQDRQLERYQDYLERQYPHCRKVLVFLAPRGRVATTGLSTKEVPIVTLTWREIAALLDEHPPADNETRTWCKQVSRHIEDDIMGEGELHKRVRELYQEEGMPEVLETIFEHKPRLRDIASAWEHAVKAYVLKATQLGIDCYRHPPKRGDVRELQVRVKSWKNKRLPFWFLLYSYGHQPSLRVMLHDSDYQSVDCQSALNRFAAQNRDLIKPGYPYIASWGQWRCVFNDEPAADDATSVIDSSTYDEITVKLALEQFDQKFRLLQPLVEQFRTID